MRTLLKAAALAALILVPLQAHAGFVSGLAVGMALGSSTSSSQSPSAQFDLAQVNLPSDPKICHFDSSGQNFITFTGKVMNIQIAHMADIAETLTDQGTKTDGKITASDLLLIRHFADMAIYSTGYASFLAPHESRILCGLSLLVLGKNIVEFK